MSRIGYGRYSANKGKNRVQYAVEMYAIAKELEILDEQLVFQLKNHFERDIKLYIRDNFDKEQVFKILREFDVSDKIKNCKNRMNKNQNYKNNKIKTFKLCNVMVNKKRMFRRLRRLEIRNKWRKIKADARMLSSLFTTSARSN